MTACSNLQAELDQLTKAHLDNAQSFIHLGQSQGSGNADANDMKMIEEARQLQQHKGQLEVRMKVLEEHNRQLETQLYRLRQLLDQVIEQWHSHLLSSFNMHVCQIYNSLLKPCSPQSCFY